MPAELTARVARAIKAQQLLEPGARVLVAVSGGADSVALLLVLKGLAGRSRYRLCAAHVNHGLRGRQADSDQVFVERLCRRLEIPCLVLRADVRRLAQEQKLGQEEAGRELRYFLLEQAADALGCPQIALAHNARDNAETVLMHLVRGTGLAGLAGIPVRRGRIVRPLLGVDRPEVEAFLRARRVGWCKDASNRRVEFRRNWVRFRLLPLLERKNPQMVQALSRLARVVGDEDRLLDELAGRQAARVARRTALGWQLDTRRLLAYNVALRRRIVKYLVPRFDAEGVDTVLEVAGKGGRRDLTGGCAVHKTGDRLSIGRPEPRSGFQQPVSLSGVTRIRKLGLALDASIETAPKRDWSKRAGRSLQSFDMLDIKPPVIARSRRAGEKMVVFGGPERKVKDVLIDDGIPRQERDRLPVLSDRKGILWIAGSRRAERGRITPRTRRVLTLKVRNG